MTNPPIKYPVGIQDFRKLREQNYLYVDKTSLIYSLISEGGYIFLSRPRRFGKSLLLSTIEAFYRGEKDLFSGLAIERLEKDWTPHPVLHLDLNNREYVNPDSLIKELNANLERWESLYGDEKKDRDPEERFAYIIEQACLKTGKKVVILVDEYDKPMLGAINDEATAEKYRSILKAFYSNLKTMDRYIEFGMLTGVARFSKISIFSDLNNLRDISFETKYSSICGITDEELDTFFKRGIDSLSVAIGKETPEVRKELKTRYDGYCFSKNGTAIYNPFSLINVFAKQDFGSYWFDSGTPTHLVELIRKQDWKLSNLAPVEVQTGYLETAGIMTSDPVPSLYQAGYLTIKEYDAHFRTYTLDYPNEEVKEGFFNFLIPEYIGDNSHGNGFSIKRFLNYIKAGDAEQFMSLTGSMLAGVPYNEKGSPESHFQNALYILFTLLGLHVSVEQRTSDGRIDMIIHTSDYVYIFEFKCNRSAEDALKQIQEKQYWLPYRDSGKEIILIGADFNTEKRRLSSYLIERLAK